MTDEIGPDAGVLSHSDEVSFACPPPWSNPLRLERHAYLLRYPPNGRKTVLYYRSKVDFFAKNVQSQGRVMRIIFYHDENRVMISEVHEWYENRQDRMYKRSRYYRGTMKHVEYYHPGRLGEVKQWTE